MRATRASAAAWGLGACAASVALVAAAQTEPRVTVVTLHWVAPVGCPDEASVRDDVQRLLSGSQASGTARADVTHTGDTWRVVVAMNGGERRLEAASCRALADATALIVAMAVDPARVVANRASQSASAPDAGMAVDAGVATLAVAASGTPDAGPVAATSTPTATATPTATPTETPTPPPPAHPATPPTKDTAFSASASLASDFGSLPKPTLGPSAAFAWTPWHLRIELSGAYFFPSSTPNTTLTVGPPPASTSSAYARFTLLAAALRACWSFRAASFEGGPCLEGEVTSLRGTGGGPAVNATSGSSGWVAAGGELFGAWRFTRSIGVIARADALIPTKRPDFQVDAVSLHAPGTSTARLSLGVELRF